MTETAKEQIKARLDKAIDVEKLSQRDTACFLNIPQCYISLIRNPKFWKNVTREAWEKTLAWINSGLTLRQYGEKHAKPSEINPEEKDQIIVEKNMDTDTPEPRTVTAEGAMVSLPYFNEVIQQHQVKVNELIKEIEALKNRPVQPIIQERQERQAVAIDLEINILINGKKFILS